MSSVFTKTEKYFKVQKNSNANVKGQFIKRLGNDNNLDLSP